MAKSLMLAIVPASGLLALGCLTPQTGDTSARSKTIQSRCEGAEIHLQPMHTRSDVKWPTARCRAMAAGLLSKKLHRIHLAGKNADNLGHQCGGWTIDWQGGGGRVTSGTTILQAVREAVGPAAEVTYSIDGAGAEGAAAGIVVIGETAYAEGAGDRADLNLGPEDVAAVKAVKDAGVPVVVVLISGRPLIMGNTLNAADALIAAWSPGSEGQGVSDVIFGDYHPTGKLSVSWPRHMKQVPINVGDPDYDPLFPYGYGLTYQGNQGSAEKASPLSDRSS